MSKLVFFKSKRLNSFPEGTNLTMDPLKYAYLYFQPHLHFNQCAVGAICNGYHTKALVEYNNYYHYC